MTIRGESRFPARKPVVVKIPVLIMLGITGAAALATPNSRFQVVCSEHFRLSM
jgi:hypothetical protein